MKGQIIATPCWQVECWHPDCGAQMRVAVPVDVAVNGLMRFHQEIQADGWRFLSNAWTCPNCANTKPLEVKP